MEKKVQNRQNYCSENYYHIHLYRLPYHIEYHVLGSELLRVYLIKLNFICGV